MIDSLIAETENDEEKINLSSSIDIKTTRVNKSFNAR